MIVIGCLMQPLLLDFFIPSSKMSDISFLLFKQISLLVFSVLSIVSKIFDLLQEVQRKYGRAFVVWFWFFCVPPPPPITKLLYLQ